MDTDSIIPCVNEASATMIASRIALKFVSVGKPINESELYDLMAGIRGRKSACLRGLRQAYSYSNVRKKTDLVLVDNLWTLIPKVEP